MYLLSSLSIVLCNKLALSLTRTASLAYQLTEESPAWVYLLSALSIVLYINLDCMDGKQARRTKSSSPLVS